MRNSPAPNRADGCGAASVRHQSTSNRRPSGVTTSRSRRSSWTMCSGSNVVHLFDPEHIVQLLRRLRDVVTPDGRLLLVDWWRTDAAPHPSARFGAGEFLMISGGDLYQ